MTESAVSSRNFVLVHGAWHGGWCWSRVATRLRAAGHNVYTPTLTGLGERSHLLNSGINLHTFVDDIANVLIWENLRDVILVGHSYGGIVITGVADIIPERLQQLVYLDGFILESGVSTFDTLPIEVVAKLHAAAQQMGGEVPVLPAPRPKSLGLFEQDDIDFVESRLTPQPLSTYKTGLTLQHAIGNGLPCTYIDCTNPPFPAVDATRHWVKENTHWNWKTLEAGHAAMVSEPGLVAQTLNDLAR